MLERWDVIDALGSLVAKSMVERSPDVERYQLLESLRHFARDRLGYRLEELRRRHAVHFATRAEQIDTAMWNESEDSWRPRLLADLDNFRAATGWAFDSDDLDDVRTGARLLAGVLNEALFQTSSGIQSWGAGALPHIDHLGGQHRSTVLAASAFDAYLIGDLERARTLGLRALADAPTFTRVVYVAFIVVSLALSGGGDSEGAMAALADCQQRVETIGANESLMCGVLNMMGFLAANMGDQETARSAAAGAVAAGRAIHSPTLLATGLTVHAITTAHDDPEGALTAAEESIRLFESGAGDSGYARALNIAAVLRLAGGDRAGAARAAQKAVAYCLRGGHRYELPTDIAVGIIVLGDSEGTCEAAAVLLGAMNGPLAALPILLTASEQERYDQARAEIAAALDPRAITDAAQRGRAMSYDEIVDFTLSQLARLAGPT